MSFRFDHPELLWLLLLAGPIGWLGWTWLTTVEPLRRGIAVGLRVVVLVLLVLMLAGLRAERRHTDLTVIAVVDRSASMRVFAAPPEVGNAATGGVNTGAATPNAVATSGGGGMTAAVADFLEAAAGDRQPDDRFGVVAYDDRPTVVTRPGNTVRYDPVADAPTREGTDTAAAIEWAMAAKSDANTALRLVLVTDGNDTTGDTLAAARAAAAAGVVIDVLPVKYRDGDEVLVEGVYTPVEAREGQTVAVRVVLRATAPTAGQLQLKHDGRVLDLNGPDVEGKGLPIAPADWSDARALTENSDTSAPSPTAPPQVRDAEGRYVLAKQIDVPIAASGANRFAAVFESAAADHSTDTVAVNNTAESFTLVQGRGRVLLVDNLGGTPGDILPGALASRQINLDVVPPGGFPTDPVDLSRYDAVLFQNVPADRITGQQQQMLARYVNDLGGGFVMLGGPDSFGAGGWTNSVIDRNILPVDCEIPSQTILPTGALVICLDRSGSMAVNVGSTGKSQIELAGEAAILTLQTLFPEDLFGLIAFDASPKWIVPLAKNDNPQQAARLIRSMRASGGTNLYNGLSLAYQELTGNRITADGIGHVIMLTDGNEPANNYPDLMRRFREANITLTTVGVGDHQNTQLLRDLATLGGGSFHPIVDPNTLPQVFIKEARTIRKNLIRETEFVPSRRNTGSPIMANLPATPPLNGLVLTGPKYDRRIDMPLTGPEGEPLFAHWQVGLGKAAAWTSDATNRWATPWLSWSGYGDFWARTVRYISRPTASQTAELTATVDGDQLRVRLDTSGDPDTDTDEASATRTVQGKILQPDGTVADLKLKQVGPDLYEATAAAPQTGSYILNVFTGGPGQERQFIAGGATRAAGEELRRLAPNTELLREVAAATGGRVLDPADPVAANLFDRTHRFESVSTRPLRWLLLPWLLGLMLTDVANRRIAWDHRAIAKWAREKATVQRRSSAETRQTMSALKRRRSAVQHGQPESTNGEQVVAAPVKTKKFQAAAGTRANADFADAVGGAKANQDRGERVAVAAPKEEAPDAKAPTTNRLLAAKRRAQQKHND